MWRTLAVVTTLGAGCSKCAGPAVPDAGPPVPDAGSATAARPLTGDGGLDDATLLAFYARDCAYVVQRPDATDGGTARADECVAHEREGGGAPDPFGCTAGGEACRDGCGESCLSCAAECSGSCTTCRTGCEAEPPGQREACVTTCAKARLKCREACLSAREGCLNQACAMLQSACEDDAQRKRQKACPDCTELGQCLLEPENKDDPGRCLIRHPQNAGECLDWCAVP